MYADIPGLRFDDSPQAIIPSSIIVTPLRPDLVIVSDANKTVQVLEHACMQYIDSLVGQNSEVLHFRK